MYRGGRKKENWRLKQLIKSFINMTVWCTYFIVSGSITYIPVYICIYPVNYNTLLVYWWTIYVCT